MCLKGALLECFITYKVVKENGKLTQYPKAIHNIKLSITSEPFLQTKSYLETQHTKQVRAEVGVQILKFH